METIHDRRRDFSCVYCNKSFAQSYTLKEHIVAKHTHNFCHTWYQYWQKLYLLHTAAPLNKKLGCTYLKFILSLTISNFWWMGKHILALTWENLYKTVPAAPLNKKLDCSYLMFLSLEIYNFWSMTKRSLEKIFTKRFQQRMSGFCLFNEISTLPVRSVSSLSRTKRTRADTSGRCTRATSLGRISRETSSRSTSFLQESMSSLNIRINWF